MEAWTPSVVGGKSVSTRPLRSVVDAGMSGSVVRDCAIVEERHRDSTLAAGRLFYFILVLLFFALVPELLCHSSSLHSATLQLVYSCKKSA